MGFLTPKAPKPIPPPNPAQIAPTTNQFADPLSGGPNSFIGAGAGNYKRKGALERVSLIGGA